MLCRARRLGAPLGAGWQAEVVLPYIMAAILKTAIVEIMDKFLSPPSYIILAILNSVLRREVRLKCVCTGSLLPCIEYKELFIDPLRRKVRMRERPIYLTPKEFDLSYLLANNPGIVFSKEQIYSHVWKSQSGQGSSIVADHGSFFSQSRCIQDIKEE